MLLGSPAMGEKEWKENCRRETLDCNAGLKELGQTWGVGIGTRGPGLIPHIIDSGSAGRLGKWACPWAKWLSSAEAVSLPKGLIAEGRLPQVPKVREAHAVSTPERKGALLHLS